MKSRLEHIDTIRGISMFAMILIHVNAYFLTSPVARGLWDACQFAVPIFVFCSSYLFYKKEEHSHAAHTFSYYRKRILRLLIPYYIFLAAYFVLRFVFEPSSMTHEFVFESALLIGGVDLNWMVVLFLLISAAMPLLMFLYKRHRTIYILYALASLASAVFFLFSKPQFNYRFVMLFPWTLVSMVSWEVARKESSQKTLLKIGAFWLIAFIVSRIILMTVGGSLVHFENKYPPTLFHISYGIVWMIVLFMTSNWWSKPRIVKSFLHYLSAYSYSLFFIHFFLIFLATYTLPLKSIGWLPFFLIILTSSIAVQKLFEIGAHRFSTLKRGPTI